MTARKPIDPITVSAVQTLQGIGYLCIFRKLFRYTSLSHVHAYQIFRPERPEIIQPNAWMDSTARASLSEVGADPAQARVSVNFSVQYLKASFSV